jgi:hypothetical protein
MARSNDRPIRPDFQRLLASMLAGGRTSRRALAKSLAVAPATVAQAAAGAPVRADIAAHLELMLTGSVR